MDSGLRKRRSRRVADRTREAADSQPSRGTDAKAEFEFERLNVIFSHQSLDRQSAGLQRSFIFPSLTDQFKVFICPRVTECFSRCTHLHELLLIVFKLSWFVHCFSTELQHQRLVQVQEIEFTSPVFFSFLVFSFRSRLIYPRREQTMAPGPFVAHQVFKCGPPNLKKKFYQ